MTWANDGRDQLSALSSQMIKKERTLFEVSNKVSIIIVSKTRLVNLEKLFRALSQFLQLLLKLKGRLQV
jgi:hypothetical protein